MILLVQLLLKFFLFQKLNLSVSLDLLHFSLLTLSSISIAIAGYIINDINDVKADEINKPDKVFVGKKISFKTANNLFIIFNSLGLLIGFYLTIYIHKNSFFIIYIIISLLLFRYAIDLKKRYITGNLVVSFIVFLSILIVPVFDIVPATNSFNRISQLVTFKLVLVIAIFAFFLTLIREIVKDLEDIPGDKIIHSKTIAIVKGIQKTKYVLIALTILLFIAVNYFAFINYTSNVIFSSYLAVFVGVPLLYFAFMIKGTVTIKEFHKLSNFLKVVMLLGILSILFY
jgi:4-hydroxybenzoate polyprenyltransferase